MTPQWSKDRVCRCVAQQSFVLRRKKKKARKVTTEISVIQQVKKWIFIVILLWLKFMKFLFNMNFLFVICRNFQMNYLSLTLLFQLLPAECRTGLISLSILYRLTAWLSNFAVWVLASSGPDRSFLARRLRRVLFTRLTEYLLELCLHLFWIHAIFSVFCSKHCGRNIPNSHLTPPQSW